MCPRPFSFSSNGGGEREGRRWENGDQALSFGESEKYVTLVIVKRLLQHISRHDRARCHRMTNRILASIRSGNLVSGLLDFGQASYDLEVASLFPDGVYEGGWEGAHRLGAPVNCFLLWDLELFLRAPQRGCDTITSLCVLQASVCESYYFILTGLPEIPHFATLERLRGGALDCLFRAIA